jgi:hypothetical protein
MEQILMPEETKLEQDSGRCVNCEISVAVPGYRTALCDECRKHFIKFPIPLWIKIFGGGICLILLFALFTFPDHLSTAIHLKRGENAANNNRFVTAKKELEPVVAKYPQHVKARAYLMLSSFYNEDYRAFARYASELEGKDLDDKKLLARLLTAENNLKNYFPDDSLSLMQAQNDSTGQQIPDSMLNDFVKRHPGNILALYTYASQLYDEKRYPGCDSLLVQLLEIDDTYLPGLRLLANSKRASDNFNASIKYCERILEINKESNYAYAMMARTYLRQRMDKEGLDMAAKSMSIDDKLPYNIATMALAYHFTHQFTRRDEIIQEARASKDTTIMYYMQYAIDVIANKEPFRN